MTEKILITIWGDEIASRFDLTSEILTVHVDSHGGVVESRTVVLPTISAEDLCHLILKEGITTVICGAIEEEYYQYLVWKKIKVMECVIGPYVKALELFLAGKLAPGANLMKSTFLEHT
ncbi:MAG: dinitrogenase iron-molybdenum cofactor biosynthesis protein [Deltaproteobacteria bacterium]|nr:dinitrogenase iron-molybdenum cofactor biosynthesis protein [Deltaproteobacteria bacterium]MBW2071552.1 dinitrogenase iron-molybdenum cofactor biosynthesis protein [Deltaproteobacteria bacterium]